MGYIDLENYLPFVTIPIFNKNITLHFKCFADIWRN
jgi:hypothetical protein